jgi:succinyl-CoA synthetase beta subunit
MTVLKNAHFNANSIYDLIKREREIYLSAVKTGDKKKIESILSEHSNFMIEQIRQAKEEKKQPKAKPTPAVQDTSNRRQTRNYARELEAQGKQSVVAQHTAMEKKYKEFAKTWSANPYN